MFPRMHGRRKSNAARLSSTDTKPVMSSLTGSHTEILGWVLRQPVLVDGLLDGPADSVVHQLRLADALPDVRRGIRMISNESDAADLGQLFHW